MHEKKFGIAFKGEYSLKKGNIVKPIDITILDNKRKIEYKNKLLKLLIKTVDGINDKNNTPYKSKFEKRITTCFEGKLSLLFDSFTENNKKEWSKIFQLIQNNNFIVYKCYTDKDGKWKKIIEKWHKGIVKIVNPDTHFGFIIPDNPEEFPKLQKGERIRFNLESEPNDFVLIEKFPVHFKNIDNTGVHSNTIELLKHDRMIGNIEFWDFEKKEGRIKGLDLKEYKFSIRDVLRGHECSYKYHIGKISKFSKGQIVEFSHYKDALHANKIIPRSDYYYFYSELFINNMDKFYYNLAKMSESEDWEFKNDQSGYSFPILRNYIVNTYQKLRIEHNELVEDGNQSSQKIRFFYNNKTGKEAMCLNTGLLSKSYDEIYMYFEAFENKSDILRNKQRIWEFVKFCYKEDNKIVLLNKNELPQIAKYFHSKNDIFVDTDYEIIAKAQHILKKNLKRFPEQFHSIMNKYYLESLIERAITRLKRNYRVAIPQYYNDSISWVLPFCLDGSEETHLALVIYKEEQDGRIKYIAPTILKLDTAYSNARLVARPDKDWLEPKKIKRNNDSQDFVNIGNK